MAIDYDHSRNPHTVTGARAALSLIFADNKPASLLDVGCGTGTWMKAAMELGIDDVQGVDGVEVPTDQLQVSRDLIRLQDLTLPWDLNKKFEAVLCLEVAEHLDTDSAEILIAALAKHGATIYFSAACPGQHGQHHVNCQWPIYWQQMFNDRGFTCDDSIRWYIWNDQRIEPWYRQNLFVARHQPQKAGLEPKLKGVVHPEIFIGVMDYMRQGFEESRWSGRAISLARRHLSKAKWNLARSLKNRGRLKTLWKSPKGSR